eukprot:4477183-Alexandrium_andersonii.AAC.1
MHNPGTSRGRDDQARAVIALQVLLCRCTGCRDAARGDRTDWHPRRISVPCVLASGRDHALEFLNAPQHSRLCMRLVLTCLPQLRRQHLGCAQAVKERGG